MWHDQRILDLLDIEHPIIQAPMASASDEPLLPYPAQYSISRELRKTASERGDAEFIAMWAGQGVGLIRRRPAVDLVNDLVAESQQLLARLAQA